MPIVSISLNDEILSQLDLLRKGFLIQKPKIGKGIILIKKFRHIDPEIFNNGKLVVLSEIYSGYKKILENEKNNHQIKQELQILPLK